MKLSTLLALVLSALSLHAPAQTGLRDIHSHGMPIRVLYPTAETNRPIHSGGYAFEAAPDAPPLPGPRRLVVLSHGAGGNPVVDHTLAATLVRSGFVVAQPLHRGDNFRDASHAGPAAWQTRPGEVSETIHALSQDAMLGPLLQTDRVGVHGISAGGVTGLVLAGAQWRAIDLLRHCTAHLDEDIGFCLYGLRQSPLAQQFRRLQFAVTRYTPEALLPAALFTVHGGLARPEDPRPDPRVAAVSLLVPLGAIFTPSSLERIRIPVGVTVGEADQILVPRFHSGYVLRSCSACRLLSSHPSAGHFDWLSPWPAEKAREVAAPQMRGGLPNPAFSSAERQSGFEDIARFFVQQLMRP